VKGINLFPKESLIIGSMGCRRQKVAGGRTAQSYVSMGIVSGRHHVQPADRPSLLNNMRQLMGQKRPAI
jgi:hypothetical protein